MIGRGEIAGDLSCRLDATVVVKLGSIVQGECGETLGGASYRGDHRLCSHVGIASAKLANLRKAAFALDHGQECVMQVTADDGVCFPMSECRAGRYLGRALADVTLCGDTAASIG